MKILKLITITLLIFATACGKKGDEPVVEPDRSSNSSFQPITVGSNWTYQRSGPGLSNLPLITVTSTGKTIVVNNHTYKIINDAVSGYTTYLYQNDHQFYTSDFSNNETEYLDDSLPVSATWVTQVYYEPVYKKTSRLLGTIVEKGLTRVINGKAVNNITHTLLKLQIDIGDGKGFQNDGNTLTYDYFVAQTVGIVETRETGSTNLLLTAYEIK